MAHNGHLEEPGTKVHSKRVMQTGSELSLGYFLMKNSDHRMGVRWSVRSYSETKYVERPQVPYP